MHLAEADVERDLAVEAQQHDWYHTFELPGKVVTPGYYDLRRVAGRILPDTLNGARCLDAASCDGFWAFEMATRGAAEVVSLDLADPAQRDWQGVTDDPARRRVDLGRSTWAFELVRDANGLDVKRVDMSLYDIGPDVLGTFDFVFMGSVLLHLRDPGGALKAVRSVVDRAGEFLSFEQISLPLTTIAPRRPLASLWTKDESRWWTPNITAHRRLVRAAGFEITDAGGPLFQPFGEFFPRRPAHTPKRPADWWFWNVTRRLGAPSAWVRARPSRVSFLRQT